METGIVRFYHERKDFGFISRTDGRADVFFHRSDVEGRVPEEGRRVTFEVHVAGRGPRATSVRPEDGERHP